MMNKEDMAQKVKELIAAPTCCADVKSTAQSYLKALNTGGEREAADALVASLKGNINSIDDTIAFMESDRAKEYLGEETARGLLEQGRKVKAEGGKYCFCPACTVGWVILENKDAL